MLRIVADLGNSRLKLGRVDPRGDLDASMALPIDAPRMGGGLGPWEPARVEASSWAVATVNPPAADRLDVFLRERGSRSTLVSLGGRRTVRHALERPETAGADRARWRRPCFHPEAGRGWSSRAVRRSRSTGSRPMGPGRVGRSLPGCAFPHGRCTSSTAQLPEVDVSAAPPAWGPSTIPALAAGVFWGVVGSIRELLERQATDLSPSPWLLWTGGDAPTLAPRVVGVTAIVPDLVLQGLAESPTGRIHR